MSNTYGEYHLIPFIQVHMIYLALALKIAQLVLTLSIYATSSLISP